MVPATARQPRPAPAAPPRDGPHAAPHRPGAPAPAPFAARAGRPGATLLLILAVSLLRLVYIAWFCPYTLIEDEAHYWEWSRHLEWSYYSKGPGIAWSLAASTALLGDTELGVRAPAVLFAALGAALIAGLATRLAGDRRVGFFAVACFMLAPLFQASGWILTIDMPYLACWIGAAWAAWEALERRSRWAWPALGAALAVGFLFKYTILLLPPGLALHAALRRPHLSIAPRAAPWIAAGAAIALLGLVPVAVWNAQHDWPTLHHLLGHLGLPGGDLPPEQVKPWAYHPRWTLEFLGTQVGLVGPVLILMGAGIAMAVRNRYTEPAHWPGRVFLIACAVPIMAFYLLVSFVSDVEGNWAAGAYMTLLILAGWAVVEGMPEYRRRVDAWLALPPEARPRRGFLRRKPETVVQVGWHFSLGVGLFVAIVSLRLDWIENSWPARSLNRALIARGLKPEGPLIPAGRLMNADRMAADAARLGDHLRARTGLEPFYMAPQYGRTSLLAFYLPGRPAVYCSNSHQEGRRTQYDYWPHTDLEQNLDVLAGRPAVLVGGKLHEWLPAFDEVRLYGQLDPEPKAGRITFVGLGYHGFPERTAP